MKIRNHRMQGITQVETPNRGGSMEPMYLVFHFTGGRSAASSVEWLCDPRAGASAHLVIGRDGTITQLAPFNVVTWHAGTSHWEGLTGLNSHSIGIEMDNAGRLTKVGTTYRAWFQSEYGEDVVVQAKHKFEQDLFLLARLHGGSDRKGIGFGPAYRADLQVEGHRRTR